MRWDIGLTSTDKPKQPDDRENRLAG